MVACLLDSQFSIDYTKGIEKREGKGKKKPSENANRWEGKEETPLGIAVRGQYEECAKLLLLHNASLSALEMERLPTEQKQWLERVIQQLASVCGVAREVRSPNSGNLNALLREDQIHQLQAALTQMEANYQASQLELAQIRSDYQTCQQELAQLQRHIELCQLERKIASQATEFQPRTYFTMHLESYLQTNPNISALSRLVIVLQLLVGISHLASRGYAHLDLKLDNVIWLRNVRQMIEGDHFVIGDLGTAKQSPILIPFGDGLPGNLMNRSPECIQMLGQQNGRFWQVDVSGTDVWAVGCMMFEIFQQRHPFYDQLAQGELHNRICNLDLPRLDVKCGAGYSRLLELMWKRSLAERISSWDASRVCAMLIWEFPFPLRATDLSVEMCAGWLNNRKHLLHQRLFQERVEPARIRIEDFLEAHILVNTSPDELLRCAKLYFPA